MVHSLTICRKTDCKDKFNINCSIKKLQPEELTYIEYLSFVYNSQCFK